MNEKVEQKLREKIRTTIKEKLSEAITGADRKILFILIREIVRNLKPKIKNMDVNNKSHIDRVGSSILGIIRAMTYTPDNANYKNFKKYFPKNFNNKLVQKKLKQFHSQNDKVQVTLVTQAIKNELSEGKLTEDVYAIVDKFNQKKQDYDQVYFKDKNLNKVKKHLKKMGSKYGKMNLIKVKTNGKMSVVEGKLTEDVLDDMIKQIGKRTFMYVGARKFAKGKSKGMQFIQFDVNGSKLGRGGRVLVYYNRGKDLYNVEGWKIRGMKAKKIVTKKDIYADRLARTIEDVVG